MFRVCLCMNSCNDIGINVIVYTRICYNKNLIMKQIKYVLERRTNRKYVRFKSKKKEKKYKRLDCIM